MRKFLVQLGILSSIVLLACFLLSEVTFSDDFLVYKTKDTAFKKIGWNLNLINNEPKRLENSIVFLGSSLVQGGINDSLLQQSGISAINMGVPHNGNEIGLYFLERIKDKDPKEVIFLKGKTPFNGLHKMTPLLYTSSELFEGGQRFNPDYISFVFKKTKLCLEYIFFKMLQKQPKADLEYSNFLSRPYGVVYATDTVSTKIYNETVLENTKKKSDEYYNLYQNDFLYQDEINGSAFSNNLKIAKRKLVLTAWVENNFITNIKSQESFIESAIQICKRNEIKVGKIYIPKLVDVKNYSNVPYNRNFYKPVPSDSIGVYHLDSFQFLKAKEHWADFDHLDESGADLFTKEVLKTLQN
ncbi:hypothetical protein [Flagellimonas crocea]|uniref:hypothetical protein n=1 Tax=Flagellimonas crocea TaxID=3067311 RepID=UPI00296FBC9F|nr:hypothetical protein [Muricauda sp. DH64]